MKFLLDTHILIWAASNPAQLKPSHKDILQNPDTSKFISIASLWEIQIKRMLGKLPELGDDFFEMIEHTPYLLLPVNLRHIQQLSRLPFHHKDPFDRMLVAQAQAADLTILTIDAHIPMYDVNVV